MTWEKLVDHYEYALIQLIREVSVRFYDLPYTTDFEQMLRQFNFNWNLEIDEATLYSAIKFICEDEFVRKPR